MNAIDPEGKNVIAVEVCTAVLIGGVMVVVCYNHINNMRTGTLVPAWPEMPAPDCKNIPERCRIEYEICKQAANRESSDVKRAAKKTWCWTKFVVCLAGVASKL